MNEWLEAIGGKASHLTKKDFLKPYDLRELIVRILLSAATSANAANYDKIALLLRELRATDEYLQRCDSQATPSTEQPRSLVNPRLDVMDNWLRGFLKTGPKTSGEVRLSGAVAGWSERELRKARQRIGAVICQHGYPRQTTWRIVEIEGEN